MSREVYTYPIVKPPNTYTPQSPSMVQVEELYRSTGFPHSTPGKGTITGALRGSTATYLAQDGTLSFRTRESDADYYVITNTANRIGAGYLIYHVTPPGSEKPREVDVLYFSPERMRLEQDHRYKIFLASKLVQPGWAVTHPEILEKFRADAMASLVLRECTRRGIVRLTPTGAARLVIERDLYAEPWRLTSLRGAYRDSPQRDRQKAQLLSLASQALANLQNEGVVTDQTLQYKSPEEKIYEIGMLDRYVKVDPRVDRAMSIWHFIYDQMRILISSRQGFSVENAARILMKLRSLASNADIAYDASKVFDEQEI